MEDSLRRNLRRRPVLTLPESRSRLRLVCILLLGSAVPALAQETSADSTARTDSATAADSSGWDVGPPGMLYPSYMADPRRPQTSAGVMHALSSDLIDEFGSGHVRTLLSLGGRVPVLRYTGSGGQAWEFSVEGAFFGQFDASQSLENIGWDGWYGFLFSWRFASAWSTKLHYRHMSSHLGDEFIERTGRERIGYTREDITLGLAWEPVRGATVYGEGGVGYHDGASRQEALYFQFGAQYRDDNPILWDIFDWQIAADVQMFQEDDYDPGITVQGALLVPMARPGQQFRIALEFHTGRVLLAELSEFSEDYLALIFAWDF